MSKYFYRIFTIIDLHFGAMQPCSSGLGMTLEASDFRSVRRLVAYSTRIKKKKKHDRCMIEFLRLFIIHNNSGADKYIQSVKKNLVAFSCV